MEKSRFSALQIIVHIAGWIPLAIILYDLFTDDLTANPIQAIEQRTGLVALRFLLLSLACTPVAAITGWRALTLRRKALGNYGFLYAALHLTTFFAIDYGLDLVAIWRDVGKKPYVLVGATAFLMLLPLAVTSFNYWMKRLGKNWKLLHRLVYIISPLVVFHFILVVKGDITRLQGDLLEPVIYGAVAAALLILRITPVKLALIRLRKRLVASFKRDYPEVKQTT